MLLLNIRFSVDPGSIAEFEALARQLWEATHRSEPGCRRYEYARLQRPGEYLALMEFDDHDAFIVHQASDHHVRLAGAMRPLITGIQIAYGIPLPGASGAEWPNDRPPLAVDEERRREYAERYPAPDFGAWGA